MKVQQDWIHSSLEQESCLPTGNGFKNTKKPSAIVLNVIGTQLQKLSWYGKIEKSCLGSILV